MLGWLPAFFLVLAATGASAHEHDATALHFAHPLIAESPTPDTKVRLDYFFDNLSAGGTIHTSRLEAEYAPRRWVSFELDAPYSFLRPGNGANENHFNTVSIALKLAWYGLEEQGFLLGGGFETGLPTGSEASGIGSDTVVELDPYLSTGYRNGRSETVAFAHFGIPTNGDAAVEPDLEFTWNASSLVHLGSRLSALVEADGVHVSGGAEDGFDSVHLTPGVKVRPLRETEIEIGGGFRFPLTDERDVESTAVASVFYHF